jgi:hypothetical protein
MNEIWYVQGDSDGYHLPTFFTTKMGAERYARGIFPNESESERYARIYYTWVYNDEEPED